MLSAGKKGGRSRKTRGPTVHDLGMYHAVLTATYIEGPDGFTGFVEELFGISAHGRTLAEARERLEQVAREYVETHRDGIRKRLNWTRGIAVRETFMVDY